MASDGGNGNGASTVAATYVVRVTCDLAQGALTLDRPIVQLNPGDGVLWSFQGVPSGFTPFIEFLHAGGSTTPLGPFGAVRLTSAVVVGEEAGAAGTYTYRVLIARGFSDPWQEPAALLASAGATLICSEQALEPVTITVSQQSEGGPLVVDPVAVVYGGDQAVVWSFDSLNMAGLFPRVRFSRFDPAAGAGSLENLHFGPFRSLYTVSRPDFVGVVGAGNNNVLGTYYYEVAAVEAASGRVLWVNSGDPGIDNRGDPAEGGGT